MTFSIYFPKTDHAVCAIWNGHTQALELDRGCPNVYPKANESLIDALRRTYPNAIVTEVA